ncbi:MAG: site-specific DNA-methyltransferase [Chloroflexaceae bacterium]
MTTQRETTRACRESLFNQFAGRIQLNRELDRTLVSYQADKTTPVYRWFKYREGFTSRLVEYLLRTVHPTPGRLLDPFAGSGAALFGAAAQGWETYGIELLSVGHYAMTARIAAEQVDPERFAATVATLHTVDFATWYDPAHALEHIAITRGAFAPETERALTGYVAYCTTRIADEHIRKLALFAAFCVLEDISFTRKDGQYLRWDARSGRSQGKKPFDKGPILSFDQAIQAKLDQMADDLRYGTLFHPAATPSAPVPQVTPGSCLELLPTVARDSFDLILTSPPYCNRYDYTRTYALELVFLGAGHADVTQLRQDMLSCTVENKTKVAQMQALYRRCGREADFQRIDTVFQAQAALHEVLTILDGLREAQQLNNPHIVRMVRNYFYEMCFVVFELARVLAPGGHVIMVNDNVQYAGEEVPVDLILSSMAEAFGLVTERIWMLARGKGNSSQQMGAHGRAELRKCVYVWRKPVGVKRGQT